MVSARRRRVVAGLLVAFAAWPLAHYPLVRHYGLDPWKFAGWAMYIRPTFLPAVDVFEIRDGSRVKTPLIGSRLAAAGAEQQRLRAEALRWGRLVDPDTLAALSREGLRTDAPIEIVITRYELDERSARVTTKRQSFLYTDDGGAPVVW
jgi:hypothetical protein